MLAEIITIGDELLIGQVIDTNSAWIAQQLNLLGIRIYQITSVSDDRNHILKSLQDAESRVDLILITGGLGPTKDDITKTVLCDYFDAKLVFNQDAFENIERLAKARNISINEANRKQAELPDKCIPIKNLEGTAYGMWFERLTPSPSPKERGAKKHFIAMPGVPYEMKTMMKNEILPKIKSQFKTPFILHKTILTQGIVESRLAEIIVDWENNLPANIKLAYLPSPGMVRLRLSASGAEEMSLKDEINNQLEQLKSLVSKYIYGYDDEKLEELVGQLLRAKNQTLSTAESCTGGYIAHLITSVSGSSEYFIGSIVSYSNKIKTQELTVNTDVLEKYGAVSQQVAELMASGIKNKFRADYAIATTGIAGPTGGTAEKPVGTVWIAIATPQKIISKKFLFGENRERNIQITALTALNMLRKELY